METPLLSVIIPVYNAKDYIKRCLESLINQKLNDIEIILINDNSDDETLSILKDYEKKDKRIILINNEKNEGAGASRNKGILSAKGKYIGFTDNDDYISNDYFLNLYNAIIENDYDIAVNLKIENHKKNKSKIHLLAPDDLKEIIFVQRTAPWAKIFKKEFLIKNGIKFDLTRGEDIYPAFLSAFLTNKIAYSNKGIYHCTIRDDSISHKKITISDTLELDIYKKCLNLILNDKNYNYYFKLIKKRSLISLDFLYSGADKPLKKEILKKYSDIFNSKFPYIEYLKGKFLIRLKRLKTFLYAK